MIDICTAFKIENAIILTSCGAQEVFYMSARSGASEKYACVDAFEGEEPELYVGACGVACQGAIGSYYPVAGDDYGDGVVAYCAAYGLGGHGAKMVFGGYQLG